MTVTDHSDVLLVEEGNILSSRGGRLSRQPCVRETSFLFSLEPRNKNFGQKFWFSCSLDLQTIYKLFVFVSSLKFLFISYKLFLNVAAMIGVNSIHSTGRMRSRSLCSVRSGRDSRDTDPFRYPRTPRSRSLKPLAFPDLLGKTQDGQQHLQSRKKKVEPRNTLGFRFTRVIRSAHTL